MKRCLIDGNDIRSKRLLHERLAQELGFPEYYGANFDALYDCLTDIHEETAITIINFAQMRENLGSAADILVSVITDAADEYGYITLNM